MKKVILTLMFALSLVAMVQVPAFADPEGIPVHGIRPGGNNPRSPEEIPVAASFSVSASCIYITILSEVGNIDIELENLTTGEYSLTSVNSSTGSTIIPFSGSSGSWVITFTLASGEEYVGEFEI